MTTTTKVQNDVLVTYIDVAIKKLVEDRYEVLKKEFLEQLEKDKATHLAGITLYLMKDIQINTIGETVTIVLRTQNK